MLFKTNKTFVHFWNTNKINPETWEIFFFVYQPNNLNSNNLHKLSGLTQVFWRDFQLYLLLINIIFMLLIYVLKMKARFFMGLEWLEG